MVRICLDKRITYIFFCIIQFEQKCIQLFEKGSRRRPILSLKKHCPVGIIRRRLYDVFVPRQLNNSTQFKRQKLCASTMRTHCH